MFKGILAGLLIILACNFAYASPVITIISPNSRIGEEITIRGTGFGSSQGSGFVKVSGLKMSNYTTWADTQIVVNLEEGTHQGWISVIDNSNEESNKAFYKINYWSDVISTFKQSSLEFGVIDTGGYAGSSLVALDDGYMYVNSEGNNISIFNISNDEVPPLRVGAITTQAKVAEMKVFGNHLFITGAFGLQIYNTNDLKTLYSDSDFRIMDSQRKVVAGYTGVTFRGISLEDFTGRSYPVYDGSPINSKLLTVSEFVPGIDNSQRIFFFLWNSLTETLELIKILEDENLALYDSGIGCGTGQNGIACTVYTVSIWPNEIYDTFTGSSPKIVAGACQGYGETGISGRCWLYEYKISNLDNIEYIGKLVVKSPNLLGESGTPQEQNENVILSSEIYKDRLWTSFYGAGNNNSSFLGYVLKEGSLLSGVGGVIPCATYLTQVGKFFNHCTYDSECPSEVNQGSWECDSGFCYREKQCSIAADCPTLPIYSGGNPTGNYSAPQCIRGWCNYGCSNNAGCVLGVSQGALHGTALSRESGGKCTSSLHPNPNICTICSFANTGGKLAIDKTNGIVAGITGMGTDNKERHNLYIWDAMIADPTQDDESTAHISNESAATNDWAMGVSIYDGTIVIADEWTSAQIMKYNTSTYIVDSYDEMIHFYKERTNRTFSAGWNIMEQNRFFVNNGRVFQGGSNSVFSMDAYDIGDYSKWYNLNQERDWPFGLVAGTGRGNYIIGMHAIENFLVISPGMFWAAYYHNPTDGTLTPLNDPLEKEEVVGNSCTTDTNCLSNCPSGAVCDGSDSWNLGVCDSNVCKYQRNVFSYPMYPHDEKGFYFGGNPVWIENNVMIVPMGSHGIFVYYVDVIQGEDCTEDSECSPGACINSVCEEFIMEEKARIGPTDLGYNVHLGVGHSIIAGSYPIWKDIIPINNTTFAAGFGIQHLMSALRDTAPREWGGLHFFNISYPDGTPPDSNDPTRRIEIVQHPTHPYLNNTMSMLVPSPARYNFRNGIENLDSVKIDGNVWIVASVIGQRKFGANRDERDIIIFNYDDIETLNSACLLPSAPGFNYDNCLNQFNSLKIPHNTEFLYGSDFSTENGVDGWTTTSHSTIALGNWTNVPTAWINLSARVVRPTGSGAGFLISRSPTVINATSHKTYNITGTVYKQGFGQEDVQLVRLTFVGGGYEEFTDITMVANTQVPFSLTISPTENITNGRITLQAFKTPSSPDPIVKVGSAFAVHGIEIQEFTQFNIYDPRQAAFLKYNDKWHVAVSIGRFNTTQEAPEDTLSGIFLYDIAEDNTDTFTLKSQEDMSIRFFVPVGWSKNYDLARLYTTDRDLNSIISTAPHVFGRIDDQTLLAFGSGNTAIKIGPTNYCKLVVAWKSPTYYADEDCNPTDEEIPIQERRDIEFVIYWRESGDVVWNEEYTGKRRSFRMYVPCDKEIEIKAGSILDPDTICGSSSIELNTPKKIDITKLPCRK